LPGEVTRATAGPTARKSALAEKDWQEVQEGVEVKLVPGPEGDETFILARSADRREKEKRLSPPQGKQRLRVTWKRNRCWSDWAALSEGCHLLRTNLNETDPATLWKRYIQLTEAEWAFRIAKDELEIRPIWHQKQDRVLAHILVCFLAYVLWKTLAQWMGRSGLGDAPRTVLEELARIKSGDVVLPTQTRQGHHSGIVRLRCVTEPDQAQKVLLYRLGVTLPRRLRRIDEVVPM